MAFDWFFNEWIYSAGHPEYEYSYLCDSLGLDSFRIGLNISQVQSHDWDVPIFKMPIDIGIYDSQGDTALFVVWDSLETQSFSFLVGSKPVSIAFDPEDWVLKEVTFVGLETAQPQEVQPSEMHVKPKSTIVRDLFEISYSLSDAGFVSLRVYNLAGARVNNIEKCYSIKEVQHQGDYNLALNVTNLPMGVYFYILSLNDNPPLNGKFLIIR